MNRLPWFQAFVTLILHTNLIVSVASLSQDKSRLPTHRVRQLIKRGSISCAKTVSLAALSSVNGTTVMPSNLELTSSREGRMTGGSGSCTPVKSSDAPLHERSLCRFHWRSNFDPFRIPAHIPEVKCHCAKVPQSETNGLVYECQPLTFDYKVHELDVECDGYIPKTIKIVMACIAVPQASGQQYVIESYSQEEPSGTS